MDVRRQLESVIADARLHVERYPARYDTGDRLAVRIKGVSPAHEANATLEIERFVGGGFAGQVYRARLVRLEPVGGSVEGLEIGEHYAVKILIPPSGFSCVFRNAIYWLAYQGPFSAQVNQAAARVGVLWQKLIRRAARSILDTEQAIVDVFATFYDPALGSHGEISEWVDGRNWRFEIDDRLFARRKWRREGRPLDGTVRAHEYLAKRRFMAKVVGLMHVVGAPELARQYEWWTAKSQPNALKRLESGDEPDEGLTAIDFRAGLALLPFLPMSPADFKLIVKGLLRGDLVQFDRGRLDRLAEFIDMNKDEFVDLMPAFMELQEAEKTYWASLPDITHHGLRLITDAALRRSVVAGLVDGWSRLRLVDAVHARRLTRSNAAFTLFLIAGAVPLFGRFFRRVWGDASYASHVRAAFTSWDYFRRALRAKQAESLIAWYRDGRACEQRALRLVDRPFRFWLQRFLLTWLPPKWHRFLAEPRFAWTKFKDTVTYPIRFYFDAEFREEWLTEQIEDGRAEGMLNDAEAEQILQKVKDPYIQKYLKCVAVHLCTLPITQVVAAVVAVYAMIRFGETWGQGLLYAAAVLAIFQGLPISPGSLVRGTYVVYLMIRERNIRNYWLAVLVSYWHYVGYLGFPLQMVQQYPSLARFMAGRWATRLTRIVPVFGERGALLEHFVFDLFFNVPLSLKRTLSGR